MTTEGAAYCWGSSGSGQLGDGTIGIRTVPVAVSGGLTFQSVTAGSSYSCGVTTAGVAYCWGSTEFNFGGSLGDGTVGGPSSNVPVAVLGGLTFQSVTAGSAHSCGVTTAGAAYCWGSNGSFGPSTARGAGRLGNGTIMASVVPVAVSGGLTFQSVSAGGGHSCGVTTAGAAY